MPSLDDYQVLNLDGMEIGPLRWKGSRLTANFGGGYRATAVTDPGGGLWGWEISSGCLPGDEAYGSLIDGLPRWDYYFEFVKEHTIGGKDIFEIVFRGKRYHAAFTEDGFEAEMFTSDLFGEMTLTIQQAKVKGIQYFADGSIFDLANQPEVWGWYNANDGWNQFDGVWSDLSGNANDLARNGIHSSLEDDIQNGLSVVRLNSGTADTFLESFANPTIYDAFFVMQVREATFSSGAGLLTNDVGVPLIFGSNGGAVWNNNGLGADYQYRFNGELLAESAQTAPMNEFGVVHVRYVPGITLSNLQIGKKTNTAGTFIKADFGEIVLCNQPVSATAAADITNKLMSPLRWGI